MFPQIFPYTNTTYSPKTKFRGPTFSWRPFGSLDFARNRDQGSRTREQGQGSELPRLKCIRVFFIFAGGCKSFSGKLSSESWEVSVVGQAAVLPQLCHITSAHQIHQYTRVSHKDSPSPGVSDDISRMSDSPKRGLPFLGGYKVLL